ncbi:hypothetical protein [Tritonibacter scottomollicae]|uniref:Response regulatory domain-containing protein n=1 Tax=Tritonibacter scottomollicae TaxID=483013 RepID=A0A2T1AG01_TRISK|nr:hypothetical protein [Tritonibacter scottomollicae]PRZ47523.1 hypothetical protein CLV89_10655 [Tritonibacter scottomollicae]
MTSDELDILVLEGDNLLGQLMCDMIRMYRIGAPQLSSSEVDACQMMKNHPFDLCIFDINLRGQLCDQAVAEANARAIPVLLLADGDEADQLSTRPARGLVVRKPASEEDIRGAAAQLLQSEPVR